MPKLFQNKAAATRPVEEYQGFQAAYRYFANELFADVNMPDVLITLQRKANTNGYYHHQVFEGRDGERRTSELALNPRHFKTRSDEDILGTLVHEMVHCWQHHFGNQVSRDGYHNEEWADKMEAIGLMPSSTGEYGGKRKGQGMSHYIIDDGPFVVACRKLLGGGFRLNWQSLDRDTDRKKARAKVKYTCLSCGLNAWAKPSVNLDCGDCKCPMPAETHQEVEPLPPASTNGVAEADLTVGANVLHAKYGEGTVTRLTEPGSGQKVEVRFESGSRQFFAGKVKLQVLAGV
jgi:hypothetical protein